MSSSIDDAGQQQHDSAARSHHVATISPPAQRDATHAWVLDAAAAAALQRRPTNEATNKLLGPCLSRQISGRGWTHHPVLLRRCSRQTSKSRICKARPCPESSRKVNCANIRTRPYLILRRLGPGWPQLSAAVVAPEAADPAARLYPPLE